ncbi:MAG: hypothetical protein JNM68_08920 [Dinghuibacter sp.]|nr:hypothetical protein [Dinghuibacter sp.]
MMKVSTFCFGGMAGAAYLKSTVAFIVIPVFSFAAYVLLIWQFKREEQKRPLLPPDSNNRVKRRRTVSKPRTPVVRGVSRKRSKGSAAFYPGIDFIKSRYWVDDSGEIRERVNRKTPIPVELPPSIPKKQKTKKMIYIFLSDTSAGLAKNRKLAEQLQLIDKKLDIGETREWRMLYILGTVCDLQHAGSGEKPAEPEPRFLPLPLYVTGHGGKLFMLDAWLQDADINGNGRSDELWPGTGEQEIMLWENKTRPERCISLLPARYITPKIPANRKKPLFGGTHSGGGNISEQLVHSNVVQPAPYTGNARKWPPLCLS